MDKNEKYEQMYEKLVAYERELHERNQRRIRIGLWCLLIIPIIFLSLLFATKSNKVVFLILWIASLFLLAVYLIGVEYMDYELQLKLKELGDEEHDVEALIGQRMNEVEESLKNALRKLDEGLNSEAETNPQTEGLPKESTEVAEHE